MKLDRRYTQRAVRIERALERALPKKGEHPVRLNDAVRYAVLSGGKRVRPVLVLSAAAACGGREEAAMPAAVALELVHCYSLVHDDLPCMDDDDMRRGKPTVHKKFGEATAVLAGDALLTLAFGVLSELKGARAQAVVRLVADAAGARGMVGGQAVDIEYEGRELDIPTLEYINTHKTGALIAASCRAGALLGGGTASQVDRLYRYGKEIGLLFQIVDDIMDGQGYAKVYGLDGARNRAREVHRAALSELGAFGPTADPMRRLADFLLHREH